MFIIMNFSSNLNMFIARVDFAVLNLIFSIHENHILVTYFIFLRDRRIEHDTQTPVQNARIGLTEATVQVTTDR